METVRPEVKEGAAQQLVTDADRRTVVAVEGTAHPIERRRTTSTMTPRWVLRPSLFPNTHPDASRLTSET